MGTDHTMTPCTICGEYTSMTGTQLCNGCWEMNHQFEYLKSVYPEKAEKWIREKYIELD